MLETLIKKMAQIFEIEEDLLNINSDIKNTDNWTSLNHVSLILELCQQYNMEFNPKMVIELTSVKQILNYLERKEEKDMEKVVEKISSMAIVVGSVEDEKKVLMLNSEGEWVFPKGHVEQGETEVAAAIRELKEEAGIDVTEEECLGQVDEFKFYFDGEKAVKVIKVYLFNIDRFPEILFNKDECFIDGKWIDVKDSVDKLTHDDARQALNKGLLEMGIINE